ncbi:hypothetical protein ASPZODRAFT_137154 [Penicilliopsis zonata CBS 506.65]|uniref:Apple domain-containing protein n=1 Tax=Penicilliopsis zonata CBS 506.65 TaxID=1073090 RepID=A0A1L9S5S8_9EURO|nr:hypothetical protein ASPZODRAFT_137154 [Penicilliopsis zonata CBS 506.65]OJJ42515.1 hypothetical protein ASPZODRAFT_137154 [Penicilliopsis zonata CBS 506.65]
MSLSLALVAGLLLGQASAGSSSAVASSSYIYVPSTTVTCFSELGLTSVASIPTTSITRTIHDTNPVVVYTTVQDTVTVTPDTTTVTLTDYETDTITSTALTATDTFSTTSTEYATTTVTITPTLVTFTETTVIETSVTSTATIPTPAGFTPIVDTVTATGAANKRSLEQEEDTCGGQWVDDYQYATAVECVAKVTVHTTTTSTITATPATSTAATPTATATDTATITSTSTVVPGDVSTTLSYGTTSTLTETSTAATPITTLIVTSTITTGVTTTSFYAACATNNIAGAPLSSDFGSLAGLYIYQVQYSGIEDASIKVTSGSTAYDCCVTCIENSLCALSLFDDGYCFNIDTTTAYCSESADYAKILLTTSAEDYAVSNGNCGHAIYE